MPELPDLHVYAKNLNKAVANKNITALKMYYKDKPSTYFTEYFEKIQGTKITVIEREGKELRFFLENGNSFNVHLMLNGRFRIHKTQDEDVISSKIISLDFDDGNTLTLSDYQDMAKFTLNAPQSPVPDALSKDFTFDYFLMQVNLSKRKNIKGFLIDQHIIRGIGNAYADEILYEANISPESVTGKIPGEKLKDLFNAVISVLNWAIEKIEEAAPDTINKEIRNFLKLHNTGIKETAKGERIFTGTIQKKYTYFTNSQITYK
jgi:formamidopyrimidine-DNA glycosylase